MAFLTVGCDTTSNVESSKYVSVDPNFKPYVDRFFQFSKNFGGASVPDNLVVELDYSMTPPQYGKEWTLALCLRGGGIIPTVRINAHFWNNLYYTHADREALFFHELGHCVLNREHDNKRALTKDLQELIPVSIMNPYHLGRKKYSINYQYYIKELFYQPVDSSLYSFGPSLFDTAYYTAGEEILPVAILNSDSDSDSDLYTPIPESIETSVSSSITVAMGKINHDGQFDIENIYCGEE